MPPCRQSINDQNTCFLIQWILHNVDGYKYLLPFHTALDLPYIRAIHISKFHHILYFHVSFLCGCFWRCLTTKIMSLFLVSVGWDSSVKCLSWITGVSCVMRQGYCPFFSVPPFCSTIGLFRNFCHVQTPCRNTDLLPYEYQGFLWGIKWLECQVNHWPLSVRWRL